MIKKVFALLAVMVLALGAAQPASAEPVKTQAVINGCSADFICLYDWINNNYASGFWQRSFAALDGSNDGGVASCMNLNDMKWHDLNGSPNNTASSLIINSSVDPNGPTRAIAFRENLCGGGGVEMIYQFPGNATIIELNLASASKDPYCYNYTCPWNWYDRISAIRWL